jgi:hypothetical protein
MKHLTIIKQIRITPEQSESLLILKAHNVNIGHFIRQAIKEKLQRDWKTIKAREERLKLPFYNQ